MKGMPMKRFLAIISVCVLLLSVLAPLGSALADSSLTLDEYAQKVSALCEKYNGNTVPGMRKAAANGANSRFSLCRLIVHASRNVPAKGALAVISGYNNLWIMQYATPEQTKEACDYYSCCEYVDWVEPDLPVKRSDISGNISERGTLSWGSQTVGTYEVLNYLEKADISLQSVSVGVVDSGLDLNHPLFEGRLTDDGVNLSASGDETGMSDDPTSHGTHVAGILADNTPDSVKLKSYKIFDKDGNSSELLAAAALDMAVEDGMNVVNMSLTGDSNTLFEEAIENAYESGVTVIGAMGNEGERVSVVLPASSPYAIGVGSVGRKGTVSSFSNYGDFVDLVAPGDSINSAVDGGGYETKRGTSMSVPYVSASACLLLGVDDSLSPADIKNRLKSTAEYTLTKPINADYYGAGIVNAAEAFNGSRMDLVLPDLPGGEYRDSCFISFDLDEGEELYYTLDGSLPTLNSFLYQAPFMITDNTVLRSFVADSTGKLFRSVTSTLRYTVSDSEGEPEFETDDNGVLVAYRGGGTSVSVPDYVDGVQVTVVGPHAFAGQNIKNISLPQSVTKIDDYAFYNCTNIQSVAVGGITFIGKGAFQGCASLKELPLNNVTTIEENAFDSCGLKEYRFEKLIRCDAVFPGGSTVVLPNSVTALPGDSSDNCLYYGYAGSYAESWAAEQNADFVAMNGENAILSDVIGQWTEGDSPLCVDCLGSGLTYQWYGCSSTDKKNAAPISGANSAAFDPSDYDSYPYYYCEITSRENNSVLFTALSSLCYRFVPADYSALDAALASVPNDLSFYTEKTVTPLRQILDSIDYELDAAHQEEADALAAQINEAVANLHRKFFLVIWFERFIAFFRNLFQ